MNYRNTLSIVTVYAILVSNICFADLCAKLKDVSGGEDHSFALMEDNTLWACGSNGVNQSGLGDDVENSLILKQVRGENGVGFLQSIATFDGGWSHSLAADVNGTIWAWGADGNGRLGNGPYLEDQEFPYKVHGVDGVGYLSDIEYVSAGRTGSHSLAVDSYGYVYAWGNNENGRCGIGSYYPYSLQVPYLVHDDDPNTSTGYLGDVAFIVQAEAGQAMSLARSDDGYVWHWGAGSTTGNYPTKVRQTNGTPLTNIIDITCCSYGAAVDGDGHVWQWGYSNAAAKVPGGQMGTEYLENIVAIGAGSDNFIARTSTGRVLTWNKTASNPVYALAGQMNTSSGYLENIVAVDAGIGHYLTVDENGHGWAWGGNNGCLGIGQTGYQDEPALMSCAEQDGTISLEKTADIEGDTPDCVRPFDFEEENYLIYNICYSNPDPNDPNYLGTLSDVLIIDTLPDEVEFISAEPNTAIYDPFTKTVTWNIGTLYPGEGDCVSVTVFVNELAPPQGKITNTCEIITSQYYHRITMDIDVCCWGGGIIHVKAGAPGYNTGVDWFSAYTDLQDALNRIDAACAREIWVARGSYDNSTYTIPDGTEVYGGFAGWETYRDQRNPIANKTYLTGNSSPIVSITGYNDPNNTILDGFTIHNAATGISCTNCDEQTTIANCTITDTTTGLSAVNSDLNIIDCTIKQSTTGLSLSGYNKYPFIDRCQIYDNDNYGINASSVIPTIINSVIHHNGYDGIYLYGVNYAEIRNNTITDNDGFAVYRYYGSTPDIDNCILWGNNLDGDCYQLYNCNAYNSCIYVYDPNDPNDGYSDPDEDGNITCNPQFAYDNANSNPNPDTCNYHLDPNSPCIDLGNTNLVGLYELDMDSFDRIDYIDVDMGADEVDCTDVYNPLDWAAADGLVNMREFATLSAAWLSCDPNSYDPNLGYTTDNWNPLCELSDDNVVDIDDLVVFCYDWLWTACWLDTEAMFAMMMSPPPGGGESMSLSSSAFSAASLTAEESYIEPIPLCTVEEMTAWLEDIYNDNEEFQLGYSAQEWQEFIDLVRDTWPSP
jgi:parallel beta-helix repeat protein